MKLVKFMLLIPLFLSVSCQKKNSQTNDPYSTPPTPVSPAFSGEIDSKDVSANGCLNLEKLFSKIDSADYALPAQLVTTNFKVLDDISIQRKAFHAYSAFNIKDVQLNQAHVFAGLQQSDCKSVTMLSAAKIPLHFDIIDSSEKSVTMKLSQNTDGMSGYQAKAFKKRMQPTQYQITLKDAHNIQMTTDFTTFDPICEDKAPLHFEITKMLSWSDRQEDLPKNYVLEPAFFESLKESLSLPISSNSRSLALTSNNMTTTDIKRLVETPLRDGLTQCSQ